MKNVLVRALRTYIQALIGLVLAQPLLDVDMATVRLIAVASIPAALSALQNALEAQGVRLGARG